MINTLPFSKIKKEDTQIAGGKGASLGEMTQAGFSIPEGFLILASGFDTFLKTNKIDKVITTTLQGAKAEDTEKINKISTKLRRLIEQGTIPQSLEKEINYSFSKLKAQYVAVRSSATAEDASDASWAGELETYLGMTKKDLLSAVKKCWSSLFTPRAIFYRLEKNLAATKVSVAVVVQKMLEAEVAGVCFTVHPVTRDQNQMVIEASWGLGESVVSGRVTPDTYITDKNKFIIIDKSVNKQITEIKRIGQKTKELSVPPKRAGLQCLLDSEIITLTKIARKIEQHYGFPCDIEWARKAGKIYILQSRPITTL